MIKTPINIPHLTDEYLGHFTKDIWSNLGHSIRILSYKPEYAGSGHWHRDCFSQLCQMYYYVLVFGWLELRTASFILRQNKSCIKKRCIYSSTGAEGLLNSGECKSTIAEISTDKSWFQLMLNVNKDRLSIIKTLWI